MADDLIARLRDFDLDDRTRFAGKSLTDLAADEIARLRAEVERLRAERDAAWIAGRDAAAKAAGTYCWNRSQVRPQEDGGLKYPAVFTSHTWQDIQRAIMALTPEASHD
jgi:hypothetical protein